MTENAMSFLKKEMSSDMDNILLDSIDKSDYDDFKDYKKEMESFTFSDIFE